MDNRKVTIIGVGYVGATIAYSLMLKNTVDEIALIDINEEAVNGEVLDIAHGLFNAQDTHVYKGSYKDCMDSKCIIITAGQNRKPGQSRNDLIEINSKILKEIIVNVMECYRDSIIMIVSNPVDILTHQVTKWTKLSRDKVIGTGCMLDTSRWIRSISDYLKCPTNCVEGFCIGEHGENQQFLWNTLRIDGFSIEEYCFKNDIKWNEEVKKNLHHQVMSMGSHIIKKKGKTHYGIAICVTYLLEIIINNTPRIVSISNELQGEYGANDIALSIPVVLGKSGIVGRINSDLKEEEEEFISNCAKKIKAKLLLGEYDYE